MSAVLSDLVTRHHFGLFGIRHIDYLDVSRRSPWVSALAGLRIVRLSVIGSVAFPSEVPAVHDFVAHEQIKLSGGFRNVGKHGVGSTTRQGVDRDQLRILDRSAPAAVAHIHYHDAGLPFGGIRNSVVHPQVMNPALRMVVFADVFGVVNIAHVENHIFVATRERKQVIVGGENVVDAAGQSVVVLRRHLRMCGFG